MRDKILKLNVITGDFTRDVSNNDVLFSASTEGN